VWGHLGQSFDDKVFRSMLQVPETNFRTGAALRLSRIHRVVAKSDRLFLLTVVLPTLLAILYFGFFASDVYISEAKFVVRSPDKPATSGLGVLLKSTGFSNAGDEVYAAQEYVKSRDALHSLNANGAVAKAYGNSQVSIFDRFDPLGLSGGFEDLYHYYQGKVGVDYETTSSIATLRVRAFDPKSAYLFNRELLALAEDLVNRLNTRGRNDVVQFAAREVQEAQLQARNAAIALAAFRNMHGVVDPEQQAKVQLEMISKLQDELIGARVQLQQLRQMAPENPQVPVLETRITGLQKQIDQQTGRVAGGRRSLSQSAVQYERLELERQLADRRLAAAMNSLQDAEDEARRKQAYIERIAEPSLPDEAAEPRRIRGIFATFVLGLIAWGILRLLLAGIQEHHG
jgi:capsular polysaccharide transport system permease protein